MKQTLNIMMTAGLALAAGCTTTLSPRYSTRARQQSEADLVRLDVARLQEQVSDMAESRQDLYTQMERLRREQAEQVAALRAQIDALSGELKAESAARDRMRTEIVDGLSSKISEVINAKRPEPARRAEQGYEHVVQPGQTLSAIAKAYNVKPADIVRANNISNPDSLRAGQKLFIPE